MVNIDGKSRGLITTEGLVNTKDNVIRLLRRLQSFVHVGNTYEEEQYDYNADFYVCIRKKRKTIDQNPKKPRWFSVASDYAVDRFIVAYKKDELLRDKGGAVVFKKVLILILRFPDTSRARASSVQYISLTMIIIFAKLDD